MIRTQNKPCVMKPEVMNLRLGIGHLGDLIVDGLENQTFASVRKKLSRWLNLLKDCPVKRNLR
jgi:hypothetical protein